MCSTGLKWCRSRLREILFFDSLQLFAPHSPPPPIPAQSFLFPCPPWPAGLSEDGIPRRVRDPPPEFVDGAEKDQPVLGEEAQDGGFVVPHQPESSPPRRRKE